jgi:threonine/homoserine/homoserine lactone efflux protein
MGIHDLWLFIGAGLLLNITPGPDMALIIARSTQRGTRAGLAAALGVGAGAFVHITAAAIGTSAIIMASARAFTVLKWLGALYLIYVGIEMIRTSTHAAKPQDKPRVWAADGLRGIFIQGFFTNVLNPKVAMFFLAFLPQFIDTNAPQKGAAFFTLGLLFDGTGTLWNFGVACAAGRLGASRGHNRLKGWLARTVGALMVAIGVKLAMAEHP